MTTDKKRYVACRTDGCTRTPRAGYAHCDTCTRALLRQAFLPKDLTGHIEVGR